MLTFHLIQMRAPTRWRNPRYLLASLSNREKRRRKCLILPMKHSTRWRSRYRCESYERGLMRLDRGGMTGTAPLAVIEARNRSESYARSAIT